jgi:DNA polymerase-3 subunit alpha
LQEKSQSYIIGEKIKKKNTVDAPVTWNFQKFLLDKNGNVICKGAVANGVDEETAQKIFNDMQSFSSYAFNKAHAAAYR